MHRLLLTTLILLTSALASAQTLAPLKKGQALPHDRFIKLAKLINPTVVNISTTKLVRQRSQSRRYNDPFFDMFEQFMGPNLRPTPQQGLGTGFIIREDGLILTNNHVVEGADVIRVQLSENDKDIFEAELIGADKRTDTALIKISTKKKLPVAKLGTSSTLQVGEWVAAFGNPFGHGHTMTKGIISAIGREIDELNKFPFLQTDASINPGNSGGPLVNLQGEVIGVNTAIDARAQGIGFAIPINDVKSILKSLESEGGISRGYLGVGLRDLTPAGAQSLNLKSPQGAFVAQVVDGSPADKAGLQVYDFVTKLNNKKIANSNDLIREVADTGVGKTAELEIIRDGKAQKLKIKIGPHPEDKVKKAQNKKAYLGQNAPFSLGFRVASPSKELNKNFDLPEMSKRHPVILSVKWSSIAGQAGLAPGDVVLDVNRKTTKSAKDVLRALKGKGTNILRVLRGNRVVLVFLKIPSNN